MEEASRQDLLERLWDLKHDLGKYLGMPLSYLPPDAPDGAVREALRRALHHTHGGRSARALWSEAVDDERLQTVPGFSRLAQVVSEALAWEAALEAPAPIDVHRARSDLAQVQKAIQQLIESLQ